MENIFDKAVFESIMQRIENLSGSSKPEWGKMDVGQMMHHCQGPLNIILQKHDYGLKPNWLVNLFIKKSLYSDKPYRKNLPTIKAFKETKSWNFEDERNKLQSLLEELGSQLDRSDWDPHPSFGKLTREQWGKMQFKHLDHHLRQFGV